jgi:3-hydroxyacyl-CoA dehydrogenase
MAEFQKVGVLGGGTMGSQIAGLVASTGIQVVVLDIVKPELPFETGTFDADLHRLSGCDWVVEAVTENLGIKRALLEKVAGVRRTGSVISSNTSGISIREIAAGMPEDFRRHWLGTHFFNPPRQMRLLELIATEETDPAVANAFADFADRRLGKTVVRAKDTPNFIGNRIWTFAVLNTMRVMQETGLTVEQVDALTGPAIGWPKTATFRLCDLVGIDVLAHISERADAPLPGFVSEMVKRGWLGNKSGQGFYKKPNLVLDWRTLEYSPVTGVAADGAEFQHRILSDLWNYAARRVPEIADDIVAIDDAMKAGFNWEKGPFEMWDAAGGSPPWYKDGGFYNPVNRKYEPIRVPEGVSWVRNFKTIEGNASASLVDLGDGIACIEFHTKMNAIDGNILSFVREVLEKDFAGFVITSDAANFSAGGDLKRFLKGIQDKNWPELDRVIRDFQAMTQAIKFCRRPVIVAPFGLCLGGGAEVALHGAARQAHAELKMGLVEAAVGLIPAGGGCKEMVLRTLPMPLVLQNLAKAKTSDGAMDARRLGYLSQDDGITMNRARLLGEAKMRIPVSYQAAVPRTDIAAPGPIPMDFELSGHDATVAKHLAHILSGGGVPSGTPLSEQHFLDLEREAFLSLCGEKKTEERIEHMLRTGKPLKN